MRLRFWRRRKPLAIAEWTLVFYGYRRGDESAVRMWRHIEGELLIDICGDGWSRQLHRHHCKQIVLMQDIDQGTALGVVTREGHDVWIAEGFPGAADELLRDMYRNLLPVSGAPL